MNVEDELLKLRRDYSFSNQKLKLRSHVFQREEKDLSGRTLGTCLVDIYCVDTL
jgi:hypothetical protein